ncbi:hypothetical protein ACGFNU_15670 [Spirillospora sp. NPDC048911]|uniref:hypothetical protein n=1 Tax=Spirillospora sp. NPDC048911 TaxID=3364527 RepID=UPI00371A686F
MLTTSRSPPAAPRRRFPIHRAWPVAAGSGLAVLMNAGWQPVLCRRSRCCSARRSTIFASHQLGAAVAAAAAGALRTSFGTYTMAWWGAGVICLAAAAMSLSVSRAGRSLRLVG